MGSNLSPTVTLFFMGVTMGALLSISISLVQIVSRLENLSCG